MIGLCRRVAPTLVILALTVSATRPAAADESANVRELEGWRPGLWRVILRVSRDGVTSEPHSQNNCVMADQMKDPVKSLMPPDTADEKCTRTQYEWTGRKLSWHIQCNGRMAMSGGGDIAFDTREHYRGKITTTGTVNGHDFTSTIMLEGERVGECPKPSP